MSAGDGFTINFRGLTTALIALLLAFSQPSMAAAELGAHVSRVPVPISFAAFGMAAGENVLFALEFRNVVVEYTVDANGLPIEIGRSVFAERSSATWTDGRHLLAFTGGSAADPVRRISLFARMGIGEWVLLDEQPFDESVTSVAGGGDVIAFPSTDRARVGHVRAIRFGDDRITWLAEPRPAAGVVWLSPIVSVAENGSVLIVGSPHTRDSGGIDVGVADVFTLSSDTFTRVRTTFGVYAGAEVGSEVFATSDYVVITQDMLSNLRFSPRFEAGFSIGCGHIPGAQCNAFSRGAMFDARTERVGAVWVSNDNFRAGRGTTSLLAGSNNLTALAWLTARRLVVTDRDAIGSRFLSTYDVGLTAGSVCESPLECLSGFCADGVCCDSSCFDSELDCIACSRASGGSRDGTCSALRPDFAFDVECRASTGPCDLPESCVPNIGECPPDRVAPNGTACDERCERCASGTCELSMCVEDVRADVGSPGATPSSPPSSSCSCRGGPATLPSLFWVVVWLATLKGKRTRLASLPEASRRGS